MYDFIYKEVLDSANLKYRNCTHVSWGPSVRRGIGSIGAQGNICGYENILYLDFGGGSMIIS